MPRPTSAAPLAALVVLGALASLAAAPARAQTAPAPVPAPHLAVATNPLAIPFGLFTLDVETALSTPGLTFGVGGTWIAEGNDKRWADARVMYFPGEVALRGFAIGLTGGVVSEEGDRDVTICSPTGGACRAQRSETAPTLGVRVDYDWLVGKRKRMLVGLGLGAKRVLRDVNQGSPLDQVYGDGRFVVGITF